MQTEDTITLCVKWRNRKNDAPPPAKRARTEPADATEGGGFVGSVGHATYTSSWIAPKVSLDVGPWTLDRGP